MTKPVKPVQLATLCPSGLPKDISYAKLDQTITDYRYHPSYKCCMGHFNNDRTCMSPLQDLIAAYITKSKNRDEIAALFDRLLAVPGHLTPKAEAALFALLAPGRATVVDQALRYRVIGSILRYSGNTEAIRRLNPIEVATMNKARSQIDEAESIWAKIDVYLRNHSFNGHMYVYADDYDAVKKFRIRGDDYLNPTRAQQIVDAVKAFWDR